MSGFSHFRRVFAAMIALLVAAIGPAGAQPKPAHVFVIVLENEGYHITFGPNSPALFLKSLAKQGALLPDYYGIGHFSLDNYIAMISGQPPNPATQGDCQSFTPFDQTGTAADGVAVGTGCIYPAGVATITSQLAAKGLTWKAYMEDYGNIPSHEAPACGITKIGKKDSTQHAIVGDQYASRHDPFVYFSSIIATPACATNVVNLSALKGDLQTVATTPNFSYITPNLCNDGHDGGDDGKKCVDGAPGGLISANKFLAGIVPEIMASPAYKKDGLLIITFDEADIEVSKNKATGALVLGIGDAAACCHEQPGPNIPAGATVFGKITDKGPGVAGPGGGRIGAVLVSPFIKPGTVSYTPYNHYALLRSLEDIFGLPYLGYAGQPGLQAFGKDVFTNPG
jgi:hypothetical protein